MQISPGHQPRQVSFGGDDGLASRWCTSRTSGVADADQTPARMSSSSPGRQPLTGSPAQSGGGKPLDILTRATQAEARAEKAEEELRRTQKALQEAQQRQRDANQLLRRLKDANVSLRAELEHQRALSPAACTGDRPDHASGLNDDLYSVIGAEDVATSTKLRELQSQLKSETLEAQRWQARCRDAEDSMTANDETGDARMRRLLKLSENLESQLTLEAVDAARWQSRCQELESEALDATSVSLAPSAAWSMNPALGAESQLARAETESLRHRVWSVERELQEKKQMLAACQSESSRWQDRCLKAESQIKLDSTGEASTPRHLTTPSRCGTPRLFDDGECSESPFLQELSSLRGEASKNAAALEAAKRSKDEWEANTYTAVAAAGHLERQEAALALKLSMTEQRMESVEQRLAESPSHGTFAKSQEELRMAREDAERSRHKLSVLKEELQSYEKALRGAEWELERERKAAPASSAKAQKDSEAAEKSLETLRKTMQAEESLRLEVSKALAEAQHEARSLQTSLHNEECALTRCSGDLVKEMAVASSLQNDLEELKADRLKIQSDIGSKTDSLQLECTELRHLESGAQLQSQHWKEACHLRDQELDNLRTDLNEAKGENCKMRESLKSFDDSEVAQKLEFVQRRCQDLEARLHDESTQRSAAIAHAAQLTAQVVTLSASQEVPPSAGNGTDSEAKVIELMADIDDLRAVERSLRESESLAASQIAQLRSEVAALHSAELQRDKCPSVAAENYDDLSVQFARLQNSEQRLQEAECNAAMQVAELSLQVASLQAARGYDRPASSAVQIKELTAEVDALRNVERKLLDTESRSAKHIETLMAEVAHLQASQAVLDDGDRSEQKPSDQSAELMVEIASLRCLHEHAVQHGRSTTLALRNLEAESAQASQASSANNSELLGQLHQVRETCARLEQAETQLAWRLSQSEKSSSAEATQAAEYATMCASQAKQKSRCGALEEEKQRLAADLAQRERLWALELAGSNAAADAWRERCESQEATVQAAEQCCGSLREAREDVGVWRSRVQELHMERQHMESALEALAHARNSWRAKAESADRELQNAVVATSSKAECIMQESNLQAQTEIAAVRSQLSEAHLQSQSEIAAVRSQLNEKRIQSQLELQNVQEKLALSEQEAKHQTHAEAMEVSAMRASLTEAGRRSKTLEMSQQESTDAALVEVSTLRAALSDATARYDSLELLSEKIKKEHAVLQEKLARHMAESSEAELRLQEKVAEMQNELQDATETQKRCKEELSKRTEEAHDMQTKLTQADRRYSAAESGLEFLQTELSRQRRDSDQVWKSLAAERKEGSGLRCKVKDLETQLEEHLESIPTSRRPRCDSNLTSAMTPLQKQVVDEFRGTFSDPIKCDPVGALRSEMRSSRGGEPLSDVTGAWQRVQALEARISSCTKWEKKVEKELCNDFPPFLATPDERYRNSTADNCRERVSQSPSASPSVGTPCCGSLKYAVQPEMFKPPKDPLVTSKGSDPLAASSTSSSSVATRLSGCLSPVDWLVGRREALGSPEPCDMGLQRLGGRSPEHSPIGQAKMQLALPASPCPRGHSLPANRGCSPLPGGSPPPGASPLSGSAKRGLRC